MTEEKKEEKTETTTKSPDGTETTTKPEVTEEHGGSAQPGSPAGGDPVK
jgi:hypothetical protein